MRNIIFVFSRDEHEPGKVLCSEPFCPNATIDTFEMSPQLEHCLFIRGLRAGHVDIPMVHMQEGQTNYMSQRR